MESCLKLNGLIGLQKKLKKIKMIIVDCRKQTRRIKNSETSVSKEELVKFYENHQKISESFVKKYDVMHDKLYDVIEKLYKNKCCSNEKIVCVKGKCCLKQSDNEKFFKIVDKLWVDIKNCMMMWKIF